MRKRILQLAALIPPFGVAMLITAGVQAGHVTLNVEHELYPVVGNPFGANLTLALRNGRPEEYYDIAPTPKICPATFLRVTAGNTNLITLATRATASDTP